MARMMFAVVDVVELLVRHWQGGQRLPDGPRPGPRPQDGAQVRGPRGYAPGSPSSVTRGRAPRCTARSPPSMTTSRSTCRRPHWLPSASAGATSMVEPPLSYAALGLGWRFEPAVHALVSPQHSPLPYKPAIRPEDHHQCSPELSLRAVYSSQLHNLSTSSTASPWTISLPSWLKQCVLSVMMRLSARQAVTSTSAVSMSSARTG
jgi:hypothetical protein